MSFNAYRDHVIDSFRRNQLLFSGDRLPHHIELSSDAFFVAWARKDERNDFFGNRDGDHSYQQSKRDFENVDRYLEFGGFIVFDDSEDDSDWGSHRTAREASLLPRYELVAKNPNYCIRKIA